MKTNNFSEKFRSDPAKHTHAPNDDKTAYQKIRGELRSAALSSTLSPRHIISEMTRILSPNISAILPEYNRLQRNILKVRQIRKYTISFHNKGL
ncbi:hypothetical protein HZS_2968 [Henneguya salminicola]|nr:hypothetical protein HZS_2968 [Henneguya salminicola]